MKRLTLPLKHRYLVRFNPKRIPHSFTDVLVIGGGIAGTRAALAVDPDQQVVVISKDVLRESNSAYAQGGIAGAMDPQDATADHAEDTMAAGKGMCDRAIVDMVVNEAPQRIRELAEFGAEFDREGGEIALTQEGGHRMPRVVHALGDATGKEVMRAMMERVRSLPNAQIWESTFVIDLLTHEESCRGALVWNPRHGRTFIWAKQTILATGGAGRLFRETTNPEIATGDGQAIAFRAGAELRDMEFMQFHPTVLYIAGSSRHLITEAVRGEGAYLRDHTGYRFMGDYDAAMELAPRDVVSRAITLQMAKSRHPCVYLDLSHIEPAKVLERFPHIRTVCAEFGLDITRDPIPVRPGAHYMIGGVTVDPDGRTSLPGLWAAGEATSSGLHGANRLASNSLLEGLVFGVRAGEGASQRARGMADTYAAIPLVSDWPGPPASADVDSSDADTGKRSVGLSPRYASSTPGARPTVREAADEPLNLADLRNSLTSLMWRHVGIQRDAAGLKEAAEQVAFWDRYVGQREFNRPEGWELQNMLLVARMMIAAAAARTETRGVHNRSDFPATDPAQADHIAMTAE